MINYQEILNAIGNFGDLDALHFEKEVKLRHIQKGELLLDKSEVARSLFFILEGLFFQHKEDQQIIDLHLPNEWVVNHKSFITQQPADSYIAAYTDGVVLELSIEALHRLIQRSPAFLQLNKVMDAATARLYFFDNDLTPLQKYQHVLDTKPLLIQSFPLKMIASYLKITPETLSRVREKLVKPIS